VSDDDISAVNWIEKDAGSENDFIVLANQQTSAAALKEFGFKKYYQDNTYFYYPIPTGGEMYKVFLRMIQEEPERRLMEDIMEKTGVNIGYFAVNKYWWASKKIIDEAKLSADSYHEVNNGEIFIFKYIIN
jgi:hypothetical protein